MINIQQIRQKIIARDYYLSIHAEEEMADDRLSRDDIENVILQGTMQKKLTKDIRGTRYRIEGPSQDGRKIQVICRFKSDKSLIIITTYALGEKT